MPEPQIVAPFGSRCTLAYRYHSAIFAPRPLRVTAATLEAKWRGARPVAGGRAAVGADGYERPRGSGHDRHRAGSAANGPEG